MSTSAPLLTTKLYLPPARPSLVSRPRLTARVSEGLTHPLTLISAPAGFGKTTLLSEWRASEVGRNLPLAWLSLDNTDNDPARFLTYLVAALTTLQPGLGETRLALLHSPQPLPPQAILTSLINDLSEIEEPFVLVLDDYHVITAQPVHETLTFLLDHLPPQMHLALLTRADPPLPLARLRARNQLAEIRAGDLRFTTRETAAFLNRAMGLNLVTEDVAALEERTEGWIAGLQLAALSLRDQRDIPGRIAAFTGSNRQVVDYLMDEVFNRQSEAVQAFLLQTSILDRLCGSLCEALTDQPNGQAALEKLEQANLFVVPLDYEQRWYRYHHLFANAVRSRLHQTRPEQLADLHRRASLWHEQNHNSDSAIQHALAAKDWARAASLMDGASQIALQQGQTHKIKGWVDSLPKSEAKKKPGLSVNYGWAIVLAGRFDEAEKLLDEIEPEIQNDPALKVELLAVRVWAARGKGQQARAVELALEALEYPETKNLRSRCRLMSSLSIAYWHLGKIKETARAAAEAVRLAEQSGDWHTRVIMTARLALVQAAQGNLRQA